LKPAVNNIDSQHSSALKLSTTAAIVACHLISTVLLTSRLPAASGTSEDERRHRLERQPKRSPVL
jgi:hypothetical protein